MNYTWKATRGHGSEAITIAVGNTRGKVAKLVRNYMKEIRPLSPTDTIVINRYDETGWLSHSPGTTLQWVSRRSRSGENKWFKV